MRERLIIDETERGIEERISLSGGRGGDDSDGNDIGTLLEERNGGMGIDESERKSDGAIEELRV